MFGGSLECLVSDSGRRWEIQSKVSHQNDFVLVLQNAATPGVREIVSASHLSWRKIAKMIRCIIKAAQANVMMDKLVNWFVLIEAKLRNDVFCSVLYFIIVLTRS